MPYVTLQSPGSFNTNFANLTSGQQAVPAGFRTCSVYIESGQAWIDGVSFNAGISLKFGGYDGNWTSLIGHNVGITGGLAHIIYET